MQGTMFSDGGADSRKHFDCLDGLRGLAALAVALFHVPGLSGQTLMPSAYLAVDLFFCISGFVLWHAYGRAFQAGLTWRRFMLFRMVRLYPLYLISGLACLAYLLLLRGVPVTDYQLLSYLANLASPQGLCARQRFGGHNENKGYATRLRRAMGSLRARNSPGASGFARCQR